MQKIGEVTFKEWECEIFKTHYPVTGQNAIILNDKHDGSPVARASIALIDHDIEEDEVIIKDYSENQGITDVLVKAEIIGPPIFPVQAGHTVVFVHKLLK